MRKLTLRITAKFADRCNFGGNATLKEHKELLNVLKNHCNAVGRNPDEIEKTPHHRLCHHRRKQRRGKKENQEVQTGGHINKRVHQEKSGRNARRDHQPNPRFVDIGFTYFMLRFPDMVELKPLRMFAEQVFPAFQ